MGQASPDSLGAAIVDYVPYRRLHVAGWLLLASSGAALLWYTMKLIEPHLLVPVLALAAIPLSGISLFLFLRLLAPGKRVTVREQGIVLGRKVLRWDDIERVEYRVQLPSRHEVMDRWTHQLMFHLQDGGSPEFANFDEDFLTSHVDLSQLLALLEAKVPEVDYVDEPKMRKEDSRTAEVQRDSNLAAYLREELDGLPVKAVDDGVSPRVKAALQDGECRRSELARRYRSSSIRASVQSGLATVIVVLSVLIGLWSAFALLGQIAEDVGFGTAGIFDDLGLSLALIRYPVVIAIIAGAWWLAVSLEPRAVSKRKQARKHSALADVLKQAGKRRDTDEFLALAESGEPFALYLRSFSAEFFQFLEKPILDGPETSLPIEYEVVERDFDTALSEVTDQALPLYALANASDPSLSRKLRIVAVPDREWFAVACELILEAAVVVVHLSAVTESLLAELVALERLSCQGKTFLIIGKDFNLEQLHPDETTRLASFEHRTEEDDFEWPNQLQSFLRSSVAGASSDTQARRK